jgi:hypothetical protein
MEGEESAGRIDEGTSFSGQACPYGLKEKTVKKPKWLRWGSSSTKYDDLKKVRRQTDQRMKQQDVQKEQRDEAEKKNQSPSIDPSGDRQAGQGHR